MNVYWVEPMAPYRTPVRGVALLFARLRAGAVWVERDQFGNDRRLAQRPPVAHEVWETP